MALIDVLSQQLMNMMTAFGEHDQPADPIADPEGNVLPHQHNKAKEMHREHLAPYAREMADETGIRQLNSMQKFEGRE
jgi:hypothetical protein